MASAANAGGTKIILTSAPVAFTPSATVLNTGLSKKFAAKIGENDVEITGLRKV